MQYLRNAAASDAERNRRRGSAYPSEGFADSAGNWRDREYLRELEERDHRSNERSRPGHGRQSASTSPFRAAVVGSPPDRFAPIASRPYRQGPYPGLRADRQTNVDNRLDEARLLVSNNDMSVKVFAIRSILGTGTVPGGGSSTSRWGDVPKCPPRHHKLAKVGGLELNTAVNHCAAILVVRGSASRGCRGC